MAEIPVRTVHERTTIRNAADAALRGKTCAENRIADLHLYEVQLRDLPAIGLFVGDEDAEPDGQEWAQLPREIKRTAPLRVVGIIAIEKEAELIDALNAMALEIEQAMFADLTLGGILYNLRYASTRINIAREADRPAASVTVTFLATYLTEIPEVNESGLDNLDTIGAKYPFVDAPTGSPVHEDQIEDLNV